MADLDRFHHWLCEHHGVISSRAMRELGYTRNTTRSLVERGWLVPVWRGLYRTPARPVDRLAVMSAVCQQDPEAAIGFTTAGAEWHFRGMADPRVHVLVPHSRTPELPGVVVHRCRRIDPVDLVGPRADGIRLTSPPRTLFDAASILSSDATASAIEQALAERRCTMGTLMSTLERLRHPRRPGSRRFEEVLLSRPVLRGAARSELERRVREAIEAAGLPAPRVNMPFVLPSGEPIEIDLAWPEWLLAVEVDHPFWHDGERESARDKRRDRKLAIAGWLPQRVTRWDVDRRLVETVEDLRQVLVRLGWDPRPAA